ncbi:MAG: G-D-S-L family lipolytic protein, partial [Bacteroidota bacterium]
MRFYCFSFVLLILGFSNLQAQDPLRFEQEIEQLKKKSFPTNQEGPKLVFAGSSSIRMWTDLAAAFPEHRVINMGFGGSQMSDLLYFLPDLVIRHRPERVYIYEGDN